MIGNSNDETNFPLKLLLTDTKVSKICKSFASCIAKKGTDLDMHLGEHFLEKQMDRFNKEYIKSSEITVTNIEMKYIMKVIKYLKNRGILLKEITANHY